MMKINLSDDEGNERHDDELEPHDDALEPHDDAIEIDDALIEESGGYAEDLAALMGEDEPEDKPEEPGDVQSIDDDLAEDFVENTEPESEPSSAETVLAGIALDEDRDDERDTDETAEMAPDEDEGPEPDEMPKQEPSYEDLAEALQDEPADNPEDALLTDRAEQSEPETVESADDMDAVEPEPLDELMDDMDAVEPETVESADDMDAVEPEPLDELMDDIDAVEPEDAELTRQEGQDDESPDKTVVSSFDAAADAAETVVASAETDDAVTGIADTDDTVTDTIDTDDSESEPPSGKKGRSRQLVAVLLIVVIGAVAWFQKDMILGLIGGGEEQVQQVQPPAPAPTPAPEPEQVTEPDPAFVILATISEAVPAQAWLSSLVVSFDGSYQIRGIAFSPGAIDSLKLALAVIGEVAEGVRSEGNGSMTGFSLTGALGDVAVPEVLDPIPGDMLAGLAETVETRADDYGVSFIQLPQAGVSYGDRVLPFALEGSYDGLRRVVGDLCPEGSDYRVYRLSILPVAGGRTFDRVSAAFSLRTVSAI